MMNKAVRITLIIGTGVVSGLAAFAVWNYYRKKQIDATVATVDEMAAIVAAVAANPPAYGVLDYITNGMDAVTAPVVNVVTQTDSTDNTQSDPADTTGTSTGLDNSGD